MAHNFFLIGTIELILIMLIAIFIYRIFIRTNSYLNKGSLFLLFAVFGMIIKQILGVLDHGGILKSGHIPELIGLISIILAVIGFFYLQKCILLLCKGNIKEIRIKKIYSKIKKKKRKKS